ncbi:MAG: hypothetical protein Kow0092_26540 [Deferrisomatales bacterium]
MVTARDPKTIEAFARERSDIAAVYLFGSEAAGRSRKGSDLDLALLVTRDVGGMERVDLETELPRRLGRDVDLVIFHRVPPLLKHQVLASGRLVCEIDRAERIRQEIREVRGGRP